VCERSPGLRNWSSIEADTGQEEKQWYKVQGFSWILPMTGSHWQSISSKDHGKPWCFEGITGSTEGRTR